MADLEKTVSILFKGVDEISGTLNSISGNLSTFGGNLESATQPLANMAMAIEKADAALAVLAIGGMIVATSAAGKFQSGMNEIHTLLRESPEVISAFDASIEEYARNSTQSIEDIQAAIYQALSANVSYGESVKFVADAEKLAVAGKASLSEAVDLLTSTLTAYGAGWDEASKYSDVFFKTVEIGKVTIPELSSSLALVAPIAATAGVSIEEIGAALAAMTAGGMAAGPSAEYVRHAITDLIDPTSQAKEKFTELGIKWGGAELAAHGLSGKMAEIYEKTNGNIDSAAKLFGNVTSLTAAMTLGKDSSGYYAKALEELSNAAGSTDRAYKIMVDNFELTNQRLVNSMKLALIDAGKPLLDDWAELAKGLGDVFKGIDIGLKAGAFDEIYSAIQAFSDQFTGYLKDIAKALPEAMAMVDFTALIQSIKDLGKSAGDVFKDMFGDIDLKTPEGLAIAMQKVVDGITLLMNVSKGIVEGLKPFAVELASMASGALDADGKTSELAGKILGFGQGVNTAISALNNLGPALNILSGSLVLNAISSIGSLGAALAAGPWVAAAAALLSLGYAANSLNPPINLATARFDEFGNLIGDFDNMAPEVVKNIGEISREMNDIPETKTFGIDAETGEATERINELSNAVLSFPPGFTTEAEAETQTAQEKFAALWMYLNDMPQKTNLEIIADAQTVDNAKRLIDGLPAMKMIDIDVNSAPIGAAMSLLNDIPRTYTADFMAEVNEASVEKTTNSFKEIVNPDGTKMWVDVGVKAGAIGDTKKKLEEIPSEKMMEIKLQGSIDKELATIKASADTVQTAMEWTAKLEIANVEADAKRMEAAFGSVSSEIGSISDEIGQLFSKNWSDFDISQFMAARDAASQALKLQKEAHEANMKLIGLQGEYETAKIQRMKSGKALITVDSTGLEPALEMIMWQILQKVQLRANEDSASFLLGIG